MKSVERIFSRTFEEGKLNALRWMEIKRHGPKEFFGKKPDEKLDPKYFIRNDGSPRIPLDIGEAFHYSLKGSEIELGFGQHYYNSSSLVTYQYLSFDFGQGRNPKGEYDNSLGEAEDFEFLREVRMNFYRGRYGGSKTRINLESRNLGLHSHGGWGAENTFTERGGSIMVDLLLQKRNILRIAGIRDDEHKELETFLDLIECNYKSGELAPEDIHY